MCVGFGTDPQAAGAAAEPPLPPTFGCVEPTIATIAVIVALLATIAIVAHNKEVCVNHHVFVSGPLDIVDLDVKV